MKRKAIGESTRRRCDALVQGFRVLGLGFGVSDYVERRDAA